MPTGRGKNKNKNILCLLFALDDNHFYCRPFKWILNPNACLLTECCARRQMTAFQTAGNESHGYGIAGCSTVSSHLCTQSHSSKLCVDGSSAIYIINSFNWIQLTSIWCFYSSIWFNLEFIFNICITMKSFFLASDAICIVVLTFFCHLIHFVRLSRLLIQQERSMCSGEF